MLDFKQIDYQKEVASPVEQCHVKLHCTPFLARERDEKCFI